MRLQLYFRVFQFLLLNVLSYPIFGQDVDDYNWLHYTNENGLPQNSVKQIVSDSYGFLWLPTEAGLIRFDGKNFKTFNKGNTGVSISRMVDIKIGTDGQLYAISESWDLLCVAKGTANQVNLTLPQAFGLVYEPRPTNSVQHRSWNTDNNLWPEPMIVDTLQINTGAFSAVMLTSSNVIAFIEKGKVATVTKAPAPMDFFRYFAIGSDLYYLPKSLKNFNALKIGKNNSSNVLVTGDILFEKNIKEITICLNTAAQTVFIYTHLHFYLVTKTKDGNLHTKLLLRGFNFKEQQIRSAYYDKEHDRLFLGSAFNGLYVLNRRQFFAQSFDEKNTTSKNVFYEQIVFNDSTILSGKGVLMTSGNRPPSILANIQVTSNIYGNVITRATDGTIWTADHLHLYQHTSDGRRTLKAIKSDLAYSICEAKDGTLWLGTKKKGLYTLDSKNPAAVPRLFLSTNEYIICLTEETPGILWAGTEGNLYRIHTKTGAVDTIPELKSKTVRSIYAPAKGEVWICTYEDGLYLSKDNVVTHFPMDKMSYLNMVHKILYDKKGFFWLSTNNGLFQVRKDDLLHYASHGGEAPFYFYYSKSTGFNTNEFNGGSNNVGISLPNGYFTFSSMNGVVFFKPDLIIPDLPYHPINIDEIIVDGITVAVKDTIALSEKPQRLSFSIATAYFGEANNLSIEYAFSEENKEQSSWQRIDNNHISFSNLPAGIHVLKFRKRAGFGRNNYTYKEIVIQVPLSWWETLWFKAAMIISIAVAIWFMIFLRVRYLRRKNRDLETAVKERTVDLLKSIDALEQSEIKLGKQLHFQKRLNQNIAHDIHTPLKYLSLSSRMLLDKARENEPVTIEEMESIATSSDRIYKFVKNLLDYLKAYISDGGVINRSSMNMHELINSILPIFEQSASESDNIFINEAAPDIIINSNPQLLKTILHNIIDNALKYTRNGSISINTIKAADEINIVISDTGKGMNNEIVEKYQRFFISEMFVSPEIYIGFGFVIIKDILHILGGRIHIRSKENEGTVISISLKI